MQLGMIGLGRMGGNIVAPADAERAHCVVYDKNPEAVQGARRRRCQAAAATSATSSSS